MKNLHILQRFQRAWRSFWRTPTKIVVEPSPLPYDWNEVDEMDDEDRAWLDDSPVVPLPAAGKGVGE